jgi:hypothetical protein
MYQAHPSVPAPMIAATATTMDKSASLSVAVPSTVARLEQIDDEHRERVQ